MGSNPPKSSLHLALACEVVAARTGSKFDINHLREVVTGSGRMGWKPAG
jgi:hypothetical protein